jgi:hypothetical protein
MGLYLIIDGINVIDPYTGIDHDKIAPINVAINDSLIIGVLIFCSSFSIIQGVEFIGDIIRCEENRIE